MIVLMKENTTIDSIDMIENDSFCVEVTHFQELSKHFKLGTDYVIEVEVKGYDDLEFYNDSLGVSDSGFINDNREDVFSFKYKVYDEDENVVDVHVSDEFKVVIEDKIMYEVVELKIEEFRTMERECD